MNYRDLANAWACVAIGMPAAAAEAWLTAVAVDGRMFGVLLALLGLAAATAAIVGTAASRVRPARRAVELRPVAVWRR